MAFMATFSKIGSPVSLLRVPNSTMNVPTPAVHVTVVSPLGTPWRRLTVPYGMPVGVSKAEMHQSSGSKHLSNYYINTYFSKEMRQFLLYK